NFPNDAELLEMRGKRAVAQGNYEEGEHYLKSALGATRNPVMQPQDFMESGTLQHNSGVSGKGMITGFQTPSPKTPSCRMITSFRMPEDFHIRLVNATYDDQDNVSQNVTDQNSAIEVISNQPNSGPNKANGNVAINPGSNPRQQER